MSNVTSNLGLFRKVYADVREPGKGIYLREVNDLLYCIDFGHRYIYAQWRNYLRWKELNMHKQNKNLIKLMPKAEEYE